MKRDTPSFMLGDFYILRKFNSYHVIVYFTLPREWVSERIYDVTTLGAINFSWMSTIN